MAAVKTSKKQATPPPARKAKVRTLAQRLRKNRLVRFGVLWLAAYLVLLSFFFNTILKDYTYLDVFPRELIFPCLMHFMTAGLITLAVFWLPWLKSFAAKIITSIVLALCMIGYDTNLQAVSGAIRSLTPALTDNDPMSIVSAIYLLVLLVMAILIGKGFEWLMSHIKKVQTRDIELGLLVLVAYLFIVPAFSMVKKLPIIIKESRTQAAEFSTPNAGQVAADKPDIYYIVLDRYTNAEVLNEQFGYDNSSFTNALREYGFTVKDNAYANYPFTNMSVSSTINSQYTNKLVTPYKDSKTQSNTLYFNLIWQNSVAKALKQQGYQYYGLGNWYGTSYNMPLADHDYTWQNNLTVFGKTLHLHGIEANEFKKSPYFQFADIPKLHWWPIKFASKAHASEVVEQINILNDLAADKNPGGRFIFAHILVPHDPYVFNADGSISDNTGSDYVGKPIKDKYLGQVAFINTQMKQLVENIQKHSGGKAVVVINADEGPFPWSLNTTLFNPAVPPDYDMRNWSDDWIKMKFGILQAVHIPKATEEDLKNLSSVNIFRIILNRYAGYNLDYLPDCHMGITVSNVDRYLYADISARLADVPDQQCSDLATQPSK